MYEKLHTGIFDSFLILCICLYIFLVSPPEEKKIIRRLAIADVVAHFPLQNFKLACYLIKAY